MTKKLPLIFSATALAVVIALVVYIVLALNIKRGGGAVAVAPIVASGGGGSADIVFVNLDSLIRGYDMYFDLQKEFETKAKAKEADFGARRTKLEREVRDFQEKIEKQLITRSQAQQLQEGLQRKEQEMVQLGQQIQSELAEEEAVTMRRIQDNVRKYVESYNADRRFRLIISNTGGNVLLYGEPTLNITAELLAGLNESYVKVRQK